MRPRVCAFLFALAVSTAPALGAVATTKYTLTNSGWTDLGVGPLLLAFRGVGVFVVGDATPSLNAEGFGIRAGRSFPLKTTSHVWARAPGAFSVDAYAAPISGGGGGTTSCAQATTHLVRTVGGNEGGNAVNITNLICGLVADGVIDGDLSPVAANKPGIKSLAGCGSHLDGLYVLAQQNAIDAILNICGANYTVTPTGATFTTYKGYSLFPSLGLDTGFSPISSTSPKFTLNSASLGAWAYDTPDAKAQIGTGVSTSGSLVLAKYSDGNFYCGVNAGNGTTFVPTPGTGIGLFVCDRSSSSIVNNYWNGVSQSSTAQASNSFDNQDMSIGGTQTSGWNTAKTISEAHFGGSLGATLNLALYNRLRIYMTAVGVP